MPPPAIASMASPASGIATSGIAGAGRAGPPQDHVVGGDLEVGLAADPLDCLLQHFADEGSEATAFLADEMVVVLVGVDSLVAGGIAADLDPLDEVEPVELVQRAVDARPADRVEPPVDLQRGHRARLGGEQIDHFAPRRAAAVSGPLEPMQRCRG